MKRDPCGYRVAQRLVAWAIVAWCVVGVAPPLLWAAQAFQESAGQVVMEAERYDAKVPRSGKDWVLQTSQSGYSGSGYLTALPNSGVNQNTGYTTASPELVYNVLFSATGTYYVWVRGAAPTTSDDSLHAGLDGTGPASADRLNGFGTGWSWRQSTADSVPATLQITTPGLHTIHLWMREDGLKVDKLLLRKNSSTTAPSGTGPAESPRVSVGGDTTAPSGSVTINGGAAATSTTAVTLSLSATDNSGTVSQMQCSNDGATYSTPEAYATTKAWTLTSGDGTKTVYAKFKDAAGNWSSAVSATISLDTTPPVITFTSPKDGQILVAP